MHGLKRAGFAAALLGAGSLFPMTQAFTQVPSIPRIDLSPERAFIDQPVEIILRGFPPNRTVTVRVRASDDLGRPWRSHAEFKTDPQGMADVATQRPLAGTYTQADAAGLFWSMILSADAKTRSPFACGSLKPVDFSFTAGLDGKALAGAKLRRIFVAPGTKRIPVHDGKLRGTLFVPSGEGPHPGVIALGGSGGGLHELSAAFLASKGYAALALAYFSFDDLPESLENIPLEYFEDGINWLESRKEVRHGKIAIIGGSRGGELALLLGSTFHQVKAVVAVVPSGIVWGGLSSSEDDEEPAWIYRGRPVPFMSIRNLTADQHKQIEEILHSSLASPAPLFKIMLENRAAVQKASIPVEKIHGPVLLVSGKEDEIWPSTMLGDRVMARLKRSKHPFPDRHLAYPGAGHFIPLPNLPTTVNTMIHPITKMKIDFGGNSAQTAAAATDAWGQIVVFLQESLH